MIWLLIFTERLIIRRFEEEDLEPFLDFMLDSESTKYLMFEDIQKTKAGAKELFDFVYASYDSPKPVHSYVIADKNTGQYLGSCGYADYDDSIVEVYYCINKPFRGKTIATEAIKALATRLSSVSEVRAYCHPENKTAHAVAINSGFLSKGMAMHKNFGIEELLFVFQCNQ